MRSFSLLVILTLILSLPRPLFAERVSFTESIAPLLLSKCFQCHNAETAEGSYRVDTFDALLQPGDTEVPPVVAGVPEDSELWQRLVTEDPDERMPFEGEPLSKRMTVLVHQWISAGAHFDGEDPQASLPLLLPVTKHPMPPASYRVKIPVTALAFGPDSRHLLVGGYHEILRWDLNSSRLVDRVSQVGERIYDISWSGDKIFVASGTPGRLGEVRIVSGVSGGLFGVPLATTDVVVDLSLSPDHASLAAAGADAKIHLIDISESRVYRTIGSHSDWVNGIAWSQDGTRLASASRDRTAKVFDLASGRPVITYGDHKTSVTDVCFAPGGDRILSRESHGELHFWRQRDGKKLDSKSAGGRDPFCLVAASNGFWLAGHDTPLRQFDWTGNQQLWALGEPGILSITIDQHQQRIATGSFNGIVRVWNLQSGILENEFVPFPQ
jgi:WD40 repeat protein